VTVIVSSSPDAEVSAAFAATTAVAHNAATDQTTPRLRILMVDLPKGRITTDPIAAVR
jgi:hypothetical protein